jgi:hypothetical protein
MLGTHTRLLAARRPRFPAGFHLCQHRSIKRLKTIVAKPLHRIMASLHSIGPISYTSDQVRVCGRDYRP